MINNTISMRYVDCISALGGNTSIVDVMNKINAKISIGNNSGNSCPRWTIDIVSDEMNSYYHLFQLLFKVYEQSERKCESHIRKTIPGIYQFIDNRPDTSFPAKWIDLMNIQYALEDFQPDLILEVGGGVSSVIFSSYSQTHDCKYLLVDPDQEWAKSTIDIIGSIKELKVPKLLNLEVSTEYLDVCKKNSRIFDYNNETILEYFRNSSRTLIFLDGAPKNSIFLGGEIALNKNLMGLVESGIILIDYRRSACQLLEYLPVTKFLYSSNVDLIMNGKPFDLHQKSNEPILPYILEDFCFTAFSINQI